MPIKFNKIETEDGSVKFGKSNKRVKKNALKILKHTALKLSPLAESTLEQSVKKSAEEIKQVELEKKVLKYQTLTPGQKVNQFLLQKYTDSSNITVAMTDLYDNSTERINSGLNYEYHVYLPEKEEFNDKRFENRYVVSEKIYDYKIGDIYYYHIPIYFDTTEIKTDYGELISKTGHSGSKDGLLYALHHLAKALKDNNFLLPDNLFKILQSFGFIDSNKKINFGIIGNMKVEKYLLSIKPEKKLAAIEYLNSKEGVVEDRYEKELNEMKVELEKIKSEKLDLMKKHEEELDKIKQEKNKLSDEENAYIDMGVKVESTNESEQKKKQIKKRVQKKKKEIEKKKEEIEKIEEKLEEKLEVIKDQIAEIDQEKYDPDLNKIKAVIEDVKGEEKKEGKKEEEEKKEEEKKEEKKEEEETTTTTNAPTNFVYDDNKNLISNLIFNGYKIHKFIRNGIGSSDFTINPLVIINHSQKSFYIIIEKTGVAHTITKNKLDDVAAERYKNYVENLKNNDMREIPLSDEIKKYLYGRDISILNDSPVKLSKSNQFMVRDADIENRLKKFYNK